MVQVGETMNAPIGRAPARPAGRRRRGLSMSATLVLALGGLVLVGILAVLSLGIWSAQRNTLDLLRDKAALTVSTAVAQVESQLQPARDQVTFLHDLIVFSDFDIDDEGRLIDLFSGALSATPQIAAITFIRPDYRVIGVQRVSGGAVPVRGDAAADPVARAAVESISDAAGPIWGEPVNVPLDNVLPFINLRMSVRRDGELLGGLIALVSVVRLSQFLDQMETEFGNNAFILLGRDQVLAHRALTYGFEGLSEDKLLPGIDEVGDPVLAAIWQSEGVGGGGIPGRLLRRAEGEGANFSVRGARVDGASYVFIFREITDFGETPWLIGSYFPASDAVGEMRRLVWAGAAGLVVLLLSVIAAIIMGRLIARPIRRLARAANSIGDLEFASVSELPASRIRELDDQARAFNSMVSGLHWFENYVPKPLVRRLLEQGMAGTLGSESRTLTVMFTDIAGFTTVSEGMNADEVARFLNEHFTIISACVEREGGTIDKYIGDSVMAFWGAPEYQEDHAARAVRAASAIAIAVRAENERRRAQGQSAIQVRIGLHTGEAVVGNIGSPGRINYTVVGDTVNTGSRLEQLGKDLGPDAEVCILASATTISELSGDTAYESMGHQSLRGRGGTIEVFRLG